MNFNFISILVVLLVLSQSCSAIYLVEQNNSSNVMELCPGTNITPEEAIYMLAFSAETPNVTRNGTITFGNGTIWQVVP